METDKFPKGCDEDRLQRVLAHYEVQTEEQVPAKAKPPSRTKR